MSATATPASQLISLCYASSAVRDLQTDEILAILTAARRNNERLGITGMLLYKGGNFLQVLEGPASAVEKVITAIEHDPRHRGILKLSRQETDHRDFAEWTMAFRDLTGESLRDIPGYSPFFDLSFLDEEFRSNPSRAYKLLLTFKQNMR